MRVRPAVRCDLRAVCTVRIESWRRAYAGIVPADYLAAMDVEADVARRAGRPWPDPSGSVETMVADEDGTVCGFVSFGPYRADDDSPEIPAAGEIYAIYLPPDRLSSGVGRTLMRAALERIDERGLTPVLLWVLRDNARARRFYERAGFTVDGATHTFEVGGVFLPEVRYRREAVTTLSVGQPV
ncbi:MAG: GNAT family N-acetyltransferase [Mycobacteriales bacterium]|nr:MAG: GNAT family N-acetyltransferase [Pseudonocardiales bacterium]